MVGVHPLSVLPLSAICMMVLHRCTVALPVAPESVAALVRNWGIVVNCCLNLPHMSSL